MVLFFGSARFEFATSMFWTGLQVAETTDPAPDGSEKEPEEDEQVQSIHDEGEDDVIPDASSCSFVVYIENKEKTSAAVPVEFRSRPAFTELEARGLTEVPPSPKCGIFYRNATKQWHTVFGLEGERNRAPTHSATLRSERKALLLALVAMWDWWSKVTGDSSDRKYLAVLSKELLDTPF